MGSSLLKTSESGPAQGRAALWDITSPPGCLWKTEPKNTCLCPFLMVLCSAFPSFDGSARSPPTCPSALSLFFSLLSFPTQMNQAPISGCLICESLGRPKAERVPPWMPGTPPSLIEHSSGNRAGAQRPGRRCVKDGLARPPHSLPLLRVPLPERSGQTGKQEEAPCSP